MTRAIQWPLEFGAVGGVLIKAAKIADALLRTRWDFAVEMSVLRALGLSPTDLRELVCLGLIEHSADVSTVESIERTFQATGKLTFETRTCFVLTEVGFTAASHLISDQGRASAQGGPMEKADSAAGGTPPRVTHLRQVKPTWNGDLWCLHLGAIVVKQYRAPAPNQHLILMAFEEEEWPTRIDDPLPPTRTSEPKQRLHETIGGLNRHQKNRVIRFGGDGSGCGIRWAPAEAGGG